MKYLFVISTFFFSLLFIPESMSHAFAEESADTNGNSDELEKRIDFGDSYITGQSIKSGAVYLLQRKPSEIKSMLSYRESYRGEILENFSVKESRGSSSAGASLKGPGE